jgi:trehalose-6-phosphate synthase
MQFIQIEILNPKAKKLLKELADLKLIAIKENSSNDNFLKIVRRIRNKAKADAPSFAEITKEVESVRAKRYAKAKR